MDPDLTVAIREAILADAGITALLATYLGEPAVFTRRPAPGDAVYPMIVVSGNQSTTNEDGVNDYRPFVSYELATYGINQQPPTQYRDVSTIAYALRTLFHRQHNLEIDDWAVIDQRCNGPTDSPSIGSFTVRAVSLTVRLAQAAT